MKPTSIDRMRKGANAIKEWRWTEVLKHATQALFKRIPLEKYRVSEALYAVTIALGNAGG
jgi:hypothetical protein